MVEGFNGWRELDGGLMKNGRSSVGESPYARHGVIRQTPMCARRPVTQGAQPQVKPQPGEQAQRSLFITLSPI